MFVLVLLLPLESNNHTCSTCPTNRYLFRKVWASVGFGLSTISFEICISDGSRMLFLSLKVKHGNESSRHLSRRQYRSTLRYVILQRRVIRISFAKHLIILSIRYRQPVVEYGLGNIRLGVQAVVLFGKVSNHAPSSLNLLFLLRSVTVTIESRVQATNVKFMASTESYFHKLDFVPSLLGIYRH
ncbi:hypothetical protein K474DRAFT_816117 [Panus rudis PR-1116 ss-1]|nr:hypothetical protein K474DRAFT_816117 [Panus rudis PR-1116 ss-1]